MMMMMMMMMLTLESREMVLTQNSVMQVQQVNY